MTIKYVKEFEFPKEHGFTKSTVKPVRRNRGGMSNIRAEEGRVINVQDDAADELRRVKARQPRDAQERRDKHAQMARVGARERDAREEMARDRREAEYEVKRGFYKEGGSANKKDWIGDMKLKKGALRDYMDVPAGKNIPKGKLNKVAAGKPATKDGPKPSAKTIKRAGLAKTFSKMKKS